MKPKSVVTIVFVSVSFNPLTGKSGYETGQIKTVVPEIVSAKFQSPYGEKWL